MRMNLKDQLDPELREIFCATPILPLPTDDPQAARVLRAKEFAGRGYQRDPTIERTDVLVAPLSGFGTDIRVRVYSPFERDEVLPAILFVHGGGFVLGRADEFDVLCDHFVRSIDALVASVDYRLAPEHVFPVAVDECYGALNWLIKTAQSLGVDRSRVAVIGKSAGGAIAAGTILKAVDRGELRPSFQMLLSACLDDRHVTSSSREILDPRTWNRDESIAGWAAYLGASRQHVPPYAAPARAEDLRGLPPTFISTAQLEVMRDENVEYATRLMAAGVPTELHVYPGALHGFEDAVPPARVSLVAVANRDRALLRALHPSV
jgi:acetyl esterase/lipase